MLMPKKVKFRKQQRGRMRGKAWRGSDVSFGDYGLKALEPLLADGSADRGGPRGDDALHQARRQDLGARVPGQAGHQEAARKPAWARARARPRAGWPSSSPGRILFEMEGVPEVEARRAMELASAKLPIKTQFATRFAEEKVS